jgi:hypothetical protein
VPWSNRTNYSACLLPRRGLLFRYGRAAKRRDRRSRHVGNEGMTGLALYFGETTEPNNAFVQVPGHRRVLAADVFEEEMARQGTLHRLIGEGFRSEVDEVIYVIAPEAFQAVGRWYEVSATHRLLIQNRVFWPGSGFRLAPLNSGVPSCKSGLSSGW